MRRLTLISVAAAIMLTTLSGGVASAGTKDSPSYVPISVVNAPIKVAQTSEGKVAYRTIGAGPPLLLIMGYAGTMETWDPYFVDSLARHFRVIIFDNAGIGGSSSVGRPLSIDAMADQTSALISALHLGSPDVLGWSMGSMIAQALAILHPNQVRRLILCATYPGNGDATQPSQKDIAALTGSNAKAARLDLFPSEQLVAAAAFDGSVAAYPASSSSPASVIAAQAGAILAWFDGRVSTGHEAAKISVPTLVADGADDRIDAETNDRDVADQISHSRLVFYPDAGHAFLFQEGLIFSFLVQSFLVPAAAPVSTAELRERYVDEEKAVTAVGALWLAKLKSLTKKSTLQEVAVNDLSLADTLGALDDVLLSSGAVGKVGRAVSSFVVANERDASDVLAIGGQGASPIKDFSASSTNDGHVTLLLENMLRRDLKLSPIPTTSTTTTSTSTTTTTVFSY